jgi:hypothetical protein
MAVTTNYTSTGVRLSPVAGSNGNTPASGYRVALRANQPTFNTPIDQSAAGKVLTVNGGLFPIAWAPSGVVVINTYRSPTVLNGYLYKATTGGTNAASEPTWPTVVGNTVVSGTVTYTCEKGPWGVEANGVRLFRSLASTQIGTAGSYLLPSTPDTWDMAAGQSLILHLRVKQDWNASGQAALSTIYGTRDGSGNLRGLLVRATGGTEQSLRFQVLDNVNNVMSGVMINTSNKRIMDGTLRDVVFMVDGLSKTAYCYVDGVAVTQADMTVTHVNPHGMSVATVTGSTAGNFRALGSGSNSVSNNATVECAFNAVDEIVLNGPLPANTQPIATWFSTKDTLLPQSLVD